jgi:hypothetical protein
MGRTNSIKVTVDDQELARLDELRLSGTTRAASGDDPVYMADQLGHTDPRFTLSVYTKAVKRRAKLSAAYLAEYEKALAWAALPTAERH